MSSVDSAPLFCGVTSCARRDCLLQPRNLLTSTLLGKAIAKIYKKTCNHFICRWSCITNDSCKQTHLGRLGVHSLHKQRYFTASLEAQMSGVNDRRLCSLLHPTTSLRRLSYLHLLQRRNNDGQTVTAHSGRV